MSRKKKKIIKNKPGKKYSHKQGIKGNIAHRFLTT